VLDTRANGNKMTLDTIRSDFEFLDDWEDRYRYVIELGRGLPPLPEAYRADRYKVRGCASQAPAARKFAKTHRASRIASSIGSAFHVLRSDLRGVVDQFGQVVRNSISERSPKNT
jgi:Fe-S metabolism associated domain